MKRLSRRRPRFKGLAVGLDLHQKQTVYQAIDSHGEDAASGRIASQPQELEKLVDQLSQSGQPVSVSLEASGCFLWAYDLLVSKLGRDAVHVAAPSKVRVIADSGEKTDANDAWWLAYLLHDGRLPEAYVAEGDLRELRIATRELRSSTDERSDLMRRMRSHLAQLGLKLNKNAWSSLCGRQKTEQVAQQCRDRGEQRGVAIWRLWQRIQAMDAEVGHWREEVQRLSSRFKEVKLLDQELPGVGPVIAAAVWSELGDPRRYRSAKAFAKATGLTPGYRESAGRRSGKSITREGSAVVRWALTRAVIACSRSRRGAGVAVRQWCERMQRRKRKKMVKVAAARKLAEAVWRLFALGEAFDVARAFGGPPRQKRGMPAGAAAIGG